MRPVPSLCVLLVCLPMLAACAPPGFIDTGDVGPPPPLLPVDQLLTADSAQLDAEAAAALTARGAALRARATGTP